MNAWFGTSWGAPFCRDMPRVPVPIGGACLHCEEPIGIDDSGVVTPLIDGDTVTPYYDPLLAKLAVWGADRDEALQRTRDAVGQFVVEGPKVNLPFFTELLANEEFVSGDYDTGLVERMRAKR